MLFVCVCKIRVGLDNFANALRVNLKSRLQKKIIYPELKSSTAYCAFGQINGTFKREKNSQGVNFCPKLDSIKARGKLVLGMISKMDQNICRVLFDENNWTRMCTVRNPRQPP